MIGDSDNDFKAAKAAEWLQLLSFTVIPPEQINKFSPDYIVSKPEEIIQIVS